MLTKEQNEAITRTNAGTVCGELMRRYWTPAALAEELRPDAPLAVRIFGEELVIAPDGRGTPYPCVVKNGIVWTYMGPGEAPPLPGLPFVACAPEHVWVTKRFHDCNYLQANDVDPQHLSYLHRVFDEALVRSASNQFTSRDPAPEMVIEETAFGMRVYASRQAGDDEQYVRITNFVLPCGQAFVGAPLVNPRETRPSDDHGFWFHWHVPIDDRTHWKYIFAYRADAPIDGAYHDASFAGEVGPGYRGVRNATNRYRQDRAEMKRSTFAGVGSSFQDQDRLAAESQGRIVDRTLEHLGVSDRPIIEMRRLLFEAMDEVAAGHEPRGRSRDATDNPFADLVVRSARLPRGEDVRGFWKAKERA